jgi:glycosyltransferase involved in cell wall biosynthesis
MAKVVILTNLLPPYRLPVFNTMHEVLKDFEVWVDARTEHNRHWDVHPWPLYAHWMRALSFEHTVRRPGGSERHSTHVPLASLVRLVRTRPDVVITSEMGARTVFAAVYCMLFRKRLILWLALTQRTEVGYSSVRSGLRRWLVRRAESILVHSRSAKQYVEGLAPRAAILIHPQTADASSQEFACEDSIRSAHQFSADSPLRLVVVGQLLPRKHVTEALRFLSRRLPPDQHVQITLAGSGPEEQVLRRLAETAPPNLRIEFTGHVPPEQLGSVYQRADALLFPTLHDDWGLVVNEALQHGLPVLGSDGSGAVQELVTTGVEGFVHPAGDDEEMLSSVLSFYALSAREREDMSRRCRVAATRLGSRGLAEAFLSLVAAR